MGWHDLFTRNAGWKITSLLLAVLTWLTINTIQTGGNPDRFRNQALTEQRVDNTAIIPLANTPTSTNLINIIQAYDIRVLKLPDDPTQYILQPAQVTLTLGSDVDPAPDLTSPNAVKVLLDPIDIPAGINETNKQIRVLVPEGTIIKGIRPESVKVIRVVEQTSPTEEPAESSSDEPDAGGN
ncbi:MAG: hypothetical protein QGG00_10615 [Verrucomicrobiota bacterium]|jgi:hypothetical protein|nr:hypothetical protein [Verrucomicrobiota bacterium]MDP7051752.1 hypothetical protein [Verrucomicrobiota bacterium]